MDDRLLQSYEHCGATLYEADRDRYLATLFAPQDKRRHLVALYALAAEVSGIREKVSDPMPGQIRLQWWMDVLDGARAGKCRPTRSRTPSPTRSRVSAFPPNP